MGKTLDDVKNKFLEFTNAYEQYGLKGKNGALSTLFGNKKQNIIDNNLMNQFEQFKEEFNNSSMSADALSEKIGNVDERIVNYAKTCKNGELTTKGFTASLEGMTIGAKAGQVALKALSIAGNMIAIWAISEAIKLFSDCASASDRLKESAEELGSTFSSIKSDINDYKKKIEDLYKVIDDNSSSYEDTYNARQELLTIQDEMIDKFGDEAEAIGLVTDAINGQTDALDTLTAKKWQETKNKFNSDSDKSWTENASDAWANAMSGSANNFDRMINEMENTEVSFHIIPMYGDKTYEEFSKKLKEDFGASLTKTERDDMFTLSGNLDEIYDKLLNIQSLATDMGIEDSALSNLSRQAEEAKNTLEKYDEIYSQHILNDKVFTNTTDLNDYGKTYEQVFNDIRDAYEDYQDAFATGNEESIEKAKQNFAEIVQSSTEGIDDESVIKFFNEMYPDLQAVVGSWDFEVKFKAAIEDDEDNFENEVKNAVGQFSNVEDIQNYNPKVATDEQISAYSQLNEVASQYNITLEQLINKLVQMGLISSQTKDDLLDKLVPSRTDLSAGFESAFSDSMEGIDADVATEWVNSLTEEEAKLANSPEFMQALEKQKEVLNGAALSADNYSAALQEVKDAQNQIGTDETNIQLGISETIDQLNTQLKPTFDALKDAYQDIFTVDDEGKEIFTLENVDLSMLDDIKSTIDKINENKELGITIDYSSFENLANVLTNSSSTADDVHKAINELAGTIIQSLNPSLQATTTKSYQLTQSMLESLGVMNSEEVMASALGYSLEELTALRQAASDAVFDLANATDKEISMFIWEQTESGNCAEALYLLQLKKVLLNNTNLNMSSDIEYILGLASSAGIASSALGKLAEAKSMLDTAIKNGDSEGIKRVQSYIRELETQIKNDVMNFEMPEIDFSPKTDSKNKKSSSKSEKDTTESIVWIERAIENLESEIEKLDKIANSAYASAGLKNQALADQISKVNEEIQLQQQAYEAYMAKAESVGLSDNYKSLVQNGAINIEDITDEDLKKAIDNYTKWYDKAQDTQDKINDLYDKSKDLHVSAFENGTNELEKLRDSQAISEREYLDRMTTLWEFYYENQVELAEVAKEKKLALLDEEKSYLQSVANAATNLLDNQIDDLEDQKDYAVQGYKDQIEVLENLKKPLEEQLEMMEKAREKEEKILALQKAQANLKRAENQRDKLVKYMPDTIVI